MKRARSPSPPRDVVRRHVCHVPLITALLVWDNLQSQHSNFCAANRKLPVEPPSFSLFNRFSRLVHPCAYLRLSPQNLIFKRAQGPHMMSVHKLLCQYTRSAQGPVFGFQCLNGILLVSFPCKCIGGQSWDHLEAIQGSLDSAWGKGPPPPQA